MKTEITSLRAKVASLESQLSSYRTKSTTKKSARFISEIEEAYPNKITLEKDPDENARILELVKEMDEENKEKMRIAREQLENEREKEAKYVALQKAKAEEEEAAAKVAAEKAEAEKKARKAEEAAAKAKAEKEAKEAAKKEAAAKAAAELAEAEKLAREVEEAQAAAEKAKVKSIEKGTETKKAPAASTKITKKSTKKTKSSEKAKGATKSTASPGRTAENDWQLLSDATLNRKTVAEITEYLVEKVRHWCYSFSCFYRFLSHISFYSFIGRFCH